MKGSESSVFKNMTARSQSLVGQILKDVTELEFIKTKRKYFENTAKRLSQESKVLKPIDTL